MGLITMQEATRQKRVSPVARELTLTPILSQAKHRMAMISKGKSCGGKEHAQLVAPFEELNQGHGGAETAGFDDAGIAFRHGTFADVVVVLAVRGVY